MSRDDSYLYTGVTSASTKVAERRKEIRQTKLQKRAALQPNAEVVLSAIQKEKDLVPKRIWELIGGESSEESVKSMLVALKLYDAFLTNLNNKMQAILRVREEATDE